MPKDCLAKKEPTEVVNRSLSREIQYTLIYTTCCQISFFEKENLLLQCFFPPELIKSISTPTFIRNSGYDSYQVTNYVLCFPSTFCIIHG